MKLYLAVVLCSISIASARLIDPSEFGGKIVEVNDGSKVICFDCEAEPESEWFTSGVFYQIYPKSFKDSNNDGIGDLQGIAEKLVHLKDLGISGVWLSPIFRSPQKDGGYDISDYYSVDPIFGTMDDMEHLILTAKRLKIKLILDFVPNHTSDQHQWFIDSENGVAPYDDYYVWNQGKECKDKPWTEEGGVPCHPPTNWVAVFGGPQWQWSWKREKFYHHQFVVQQPDLNFHNPRVQEELKNVLRFWMKKGIDGFRVDAINHAFEDSELRDEKLIDPTNGDPLKYEDYYHEYTMDQPESYSLVYDWRDVIDEYALVNEYAPRILMTEAYPLKPDNVFGWFGNAEHHRIGSHVPFNFIMISDLTKESTAKHFVEKIHHWIDSVPSYGQPNWVLGNHDRPRLASRFGENRAEQMAILSMTLPGHGVIYNGEEIGMVNNDKITWEETEDPWGCNAGKDDFMKYSRDPVRTPFHWDNSTNAGFNTGKKPWLPIHENYATHNLAFQKEDPTSIFHLYKNLIKLKKEHTFKFGKIILKEMNHHVIGYLRYHGDECFAVAINLGEKEETVDLKSIDEAAKDLDLATFIIANKHFKHEHHTFDSGSLKLGAYDAVVLQLSKKEANSATTMAASLAVVVAAILRFLF